MYFSIVLKLNISLEEVPSDKITSVEIKSDPLFGPILVLNIPGHKKFIRITPLTDRDLDETFASIKLEESNGLKQTLGRLSQMIEELPWLCCLEVKVINSLEPSITNNIKMKLSIHNIKRPSY